MTSNGEQDLLIDHLAQAGRSPDSLHITPMGILPDASKLAHYREIGVTEAVLRLPSAGREVVLPTLDDFAQYVEGY